VATKATPPPPAPPRAASAKKPAFEPLRSFLGGTAVVFGALLRPVLVTIVYWTLLLAIALFTRGSLALMVGSGLIFLGILIGWLGSRGLVSNPLGDGVETVLGLVCACTAVVAVVSVVAGGLDISPLDALRDRFRTPAAAVSIPAQAAVPPTSSVEPSPRPVTGKVKKPSTSTARAGGNPKVVAPPPHPETPPTTSAESESPVLGRPEPVVVSADSPRPEAPVSPSASTDPGVSKWYERLKSAPRPSVSKPSTPTALSAPARTEPPATSERLSEPVQAPPPAAKPAVRMRVAADPGNCVVTIDGQAARPVPFDAMLLPGVHEFTFRWIKLDDAGDRVVTIRKNVAPGDSLFCAPSGCR
jgi:hypothetical protein